MLAPILISRVLSDFDPPRIKMEPVMDAPAGMKEWTITLRNDGRQIARYSSNDKGDAARRNLNWQIPTAGTEHTTLRAELVVEDSLGRHAAAEGSLPMAITRTLRVVDESLDDEGRNRRVYRLPSFPGISRRLEGMLDDVVATVAPGSNVLVGDDDAEQAKAVAAMLDGRIRSRGVRGVTVSIVAESDDRFAIAMPEGYATPDGVAIAVTPPKSR
jgi:hypothetical protein